MLAEFVWTFSGVVEAIGISIFVIMLIAMGAFLLTAWIKQRLTAWWKARKSQKLSEDKT